MAGKSDVAAGNAFVRLFLKDEVTRNIAKVMGEVGKTVAAAGGAITAVMVASVKSFADTGDQLDKMALRTGIAAGELAAIGFAAEQSGASLELFENAVRRQQRAIGELAQGSKMMVDAFNLLGLSSADLAGLSPEKQFDLIAERIAAIQDPTRRAAAAMGIFGRSGTMMLPMLNDLKALKQEARDLGIIPSEEEVKKAAEVTDAINRVTRVVKQMFFDIGSALSGDVLAGLESIKQKGVVFGQWIRDNRELVTTVASVGVTLLGLGTTLVALAKAYKMASAASAMLYANPVLLGLAAVAAAATAIYFALHRATNAARAKTAAMLAAADAAQKEAQAGKQMRTEDMDRMRRLETLADLQRRFGSLTAEQSAEAAGLIATLTGRYGDLGITLDSTTGKLTGVTGAMSQMVDVMRELAAVEMDKQINAMKASLYALDEQITKLKEKQKQSGGFDEAWGAADWQAELSAAQEQRLALTRELIAAQEQLNRVAGGGMDGVVNDGEALPAGGGMTGSESERLEFEKRLQDRLSQMALNRIDDQEKRDLAAIEQRYQKELKEAENLEGGLDRLNEVTERERFDVREKYAKQRAEQDKRAIQDAANAEQRRLQEIANLEQDLQQRITRQEIEIQHRDDPEAKRRALIELEHKLEMEGIAARKGITEEEKKNLQTLAERHRDLRLQEGQAAVTVTQQSVKREITTHSAAAAQAAGFGGAGGQNPQQKAVEEMRGMRRDQLKAMVIAQKQLEAIESYEAMMVRWVAAMSHG